MRVCCTPALLHNIMRFLAIAKRLENLAANVEYHKLRNRKGGGRLEASWQQTVSQIKDWRIRQGGRARRRWRRASFRERANDGERRSESQPLVRPQSV